VPPERVARVLAALAGCSDVRLDGEPVAVSAEPLLPHAVVEDAGDGLRLRLEPGRGVTETFANRMALCGGTVRTVGDPRLSAREREELGRGRLFPRDNLAELVTEVLPSLERRLPVDVRTNRLPQTSRERPRIRIDLDRSGETLSVLATLVYGDPPAARVDGGRLVHLRGAVPIRDEAAERREVARLRRLGLAPGVRLELEGQAAVAFAGRLAGWEGEIEGKREAIWFRLAPALEPFVSVADERFDVDFSTVLGSSGRRSADPARVLAAWRSGESLVPLVGGGWAPIPADWLARNGHRVADLLAARDGAGRVPRAAVPDLAALCEELGQEPPPSFDRLRAIVHDFEQVPEAPLPPDLVTTLRGYQRRGVDWLVFLRDAGLGAMLADDMGLGKTLQALCAVRGRTLVVAPTSVIHNWRDEIGKHRPALRAALYHGPGRRLDASADVTITSYALLRLDAETLSAVEWDTVVLDEAQNVKNPGSQVAQAAHGLRAGFRVALTGTPVENRLEELWSQFHFLDRGLLGSRRDFEVRYAEPIAAGDAAAAERLRRRLRPFFLRRLKREVAAELPPRTSVVLRCALSDDERRVYDTVRAATLHEVVRKLDAGAGVLAALEALLRLRQAACHPGLVPGHEAAGSAKVSLLLESLDNVVAEGHRALVFSQWTSLLDRIEPHLGAARIPFLRLDGATRDRAGVVEAFQAANGPPVLLLSLKAGGSGLNLTAADHIFLMDPWWNPAVEDQAADRAHRIGQTNPVMVYRLVAEDTIEERILALQERKRELADAAIGGPGAAGLGRDDLLELLAG
jgi:superfamily II DNA or RNA helicase